MDQIGDNQHNLMQMCNKIFPDIHLPSLFYLKVKFSKSQKQLEMCELGYFSTLKYDLPIPGLFRQSSLKMAKYFWEKKEFE